MSDYISREETLKRLCKDVCNVSDCQCDEIRCEEWFVIHDIPAADVRHVVLCRDCKHKGWVQEPEHGKSVDYCHLIERCVDKQFFCGAGERKTDCGARMEES